MQRSLQKIVPVLLLLFFALQSTTAQVAQAADCVIPDSGPWPACATGGNTPEACVIPSKGPWPPCATGGNTPTTPGECVIPSKGPWPPCATDGGSPSTPAQPGEAVGKPVKLTSSKDSSVARMPIVEFGGNIYFARDAVGEFSNTYQRTIWVTDGTSGGTYKLAIPASEYVPMKQQAEHASIDVCGGVLYVSNNAALWTVNQSGKLTKLVDRGLKFMLAAGGQCLFTHHVLGGNLKPDQSSAELWHSDGTTTGTKRIDTWKGAIGALYDFVDLGNGHFVFARGDWGRDLTTNGIWISDGYTVNRFSDGNHVIGVAGATVYVGLTGYRSATWQAYDLTGTLRYDMAIPYPEVLGQLGNRLIYKARSSDSQADQQYTLWISDGSQTGTVKLLDMASYASIIDGAEFKGKFYFGYDNNQGKGRKLWVTNGTVGNAQQVMGNVPDADNSDPGNFIVVGDGLYFSAYSSVGTRDLWRTNGSSTTQLTSAQSDGIFFPGSSDGSVFSVVLSGEAIYFSAVDSPASVGGQQQLWRLALTAQPSGDGGDCPIPVSGPWPPCATGGVKPTPSPTECVIPASGPWPACARQSSAF